MKTAKTALTKHRTKTRLAKLAANTLLLYLVNSMLTAQLFPIPAFAFEAGGTLISRMPSVLEAHREVIIWGIALILAEFILIFQLLINWLKRKQAEKKLRQFNAELEQKVTIRTQELQNMNAALTAEIRERQATQEELQANRNALLANERQLKHYTDELSASIKELRSFANIIAHDFRAPMVNINGFSHELVYALSDIKQIFYANQSKFSETDQKRLEELLESDMSDAIKYINSSISRLDRMISALLNLARAGRREMVYKEVNMNSLVKTVLQNLHHEIEARVIKLEVGDLPMVETDYLAMEQILGNLLDNAIKYLDPSRSGNIKIYSIDCGSEYLFTVEDNGCGVSPADCERIFEVFQRSGNKNQPGEGMGLAYVRTLIRQLHGRVWCESKLEAWTKIYFTIPKLNSYCPPLSV